MNEVWEGTPPRPRGLVQQRSLGRRLLFRRLFWLQLARIVPRRLLARNKRRRIFVSMMGGIGDLVNFFPTLEMLGKRYAVDFGAAGEPYLGLVRNNPFVHRIYTPFIYHPKRPAQRRLIERVLAPLYERVLLLEFANDDWWKAGIHFSQLYSDRCGCPPPDRGRIYLSARNRADADAYLRAAGLTDFIFVAQVIRDRLPYRSWPIGHYHELYRRIAAEAGTPLVVCTAGSDCTDLPPGGARLPAMEMLTVAAVMERARVFIGTDGGLTHVAAALGTPTLAIHLGFPPAICAPLGENVTIVRQAQPFEDPALTTPGEVLRALRGAPVAR